MPRLKMLCRHLFAICLAVGAQSWATNNAHSQTFDGSLDSQFAGRGFQYLQTDYLPEISYHTGFAGAIAQDGGYILHGQVGNDFDGPVLDTLVKLHHDGSLDTRFGNAGTASRFYGSEPTGVAVLSDGRIVSSTIHDVRILAANGAPLTTLVPASGGGLFWVAASTVWNDRILILSQRSLTDSFQLLLSRLLPSGAPDPDFNGGEALELAVQQVDPPWLSLKNLAVRPGDGAVALFGNLATESSAAMVVMAVTPAGALDASFNNHSIANIHFNTCPGVQELAQGGAWQRDGKLLVFGALNESACTQPLDSARAGVARLNADGTLDGNYGNAGLVVLDQGGATPRRLRIAELLLQQDQRAVIASTRDGTDLESDATLTRLNTDGSVDTSFGSAGQPDAIPGVASYDYAHFAFKTTGGSKFYALLLDANQPVAVGALIGDLLVVRLHNDAIFRAGF
ncbi:MAG: hypothetical protein ABI411_09065 [Tahibacter sp.]